MCNNNGVIAMAYGITFPNNIVYYGKVILNNNS